MRIAEARRLRRLAARQHARHRRGRRPRRAARARARSPPTSASTPARPSSSPSRRISTAPTRTSARRTRRRAQKVVILGSGPNRIGQGIEFDYCCVHAAFALRDDGFETVMINCNPETVSTDYDTVDRLYFEPLTFEDVSAIIAREREAGGEVACRRAVRRADAAEAGAAAAGSRRQDPRHVAGLDRPRRGSRALRASCSGTSASRRRRAARRHLPRKRARSRSRSASRWSCGRRTSSAAAPWRSSTTWPRSTAT